MYIYFMYFLYVYYRKDRVIIANGKKFRKRWFTRTAKLYKVFVGRNITHDFFDVTKTYYSNRTHTKEHDRIPKLKINEFGRPVFPRDFYIEQDTFST